MCFVAYKVSKSAKTFEKREFNPKCLKIIIPVAIVAVVLIIVAVVLGMKGGGITSSPEEVALEATKYDCEGKVDEYYKLLTPQYKEYMVGSQGWYKTDEEFKKELLDQSEEFVQKIAGYCGVNYKVEYEVDSVERLYQDDLHAVKRVLSRDYDYDTDSIQGAAEVTISIIAKGNGTRKSWTAHVGCVKVNEKWYVHRPGFE